MTNDIHPLSVISPKAKIGKGVRIGPFCVIHDEVQIGDECVLETHVEVQNGVVLGNNCYLSSGTQLSGNAARLEFWQPPQSVKYRQLVIGDAVHFESNCSAHGEIRIGNHVWLGSNVVIHHGARIGHHCKIASGAVISAIPQDLKFQGEESTLTIGDGTIVREFATLNRGTMHSNATVIGKNCLIMAYVHIAHDCVIGDNVILVNGVNMAGHVEIDDHAIVSGMTIIHQFVKIGKHAMVSGGSLLGRDVPPYIIAGRFPVQYEGVNKVGLHRRGFTSENINQIQDAYRLLFCSGYTFTHALNEIKAQIPPSPEKDEILLFLKRADRGLIKGITAKEVE